MKLHLERPPGLKLITAYGANHVVIDTLRHQGNLLLTPSEIVGPWAANGFDALSTDDFAALTQLQVEVALIGTGSRLRFPPHSVLRPLIEAGIGFEIMDLAAACRTYNVLASEGRAVVAALIFD